MLPCFVRGVGTGHLNGVRAGIRVALVKGITRSSVMKKSILFLVALTIPAISFAKVSDFNAMIADNMKDQTELHSEIKNQMPSKKIQARQRMVVVEQGRQDSFNAETRKDMLVFRKEKISHRASEDKAFERIANEMHLAE